MCFEAECSKTKISPSVSSQDEEDNRALNTTLCGGIDGPTNGDLQGDFVTNKLVVRDFQCQIEFSETKAVTKYDYESDAEPFESSSDESEISIDDNYEFDDDVQDLLIADLQSNDSDSGVYDAPPQTF